MKRVGLSGAGLLRPESMEALEKPKPKADSESLSDGARRALDNPPDGVGTAKMKRYDLKPGVAPSLQLKEAKRSAPTMRYLPHSGSKEQRRRQKQLARARAKETADAEAALAATLEPKGEPT